MSLEEVHKYGINTNTREIYLHGVDSADGDPGVEFQMSSRFIKNMHLLETKSSQPILIHASSPGGEWESGMAIFDTIKASDCPVTIYGYGEMSSMMSIIFQAADFRVMLPNTRMCIHYGYAWYDGVSQAMNSWNEFNDHCNNKMFDIYAEACARTREIDFDIVRECLIDEVKSNIDWFITAQEAVEWGLADQIGG